MTYFYWGFIDSGKGYTQRLAKSNGKVEARFNPQYITKTYTTININEKIWHDITETTKVIHNNNGLKIASKTKNRIYRYYKYIATPSSISSNRACNENWNTKFGNNISDYKLTDEQILKYSDYDKYKHTSVYFNFASSDKVFDKLNLNEIKDNINTIIDDVDIASCNLLYFFEPLKDVIKSKNSVNIIPYKVNLLDCFISKLDGFANFNPKKEYNKDLFEVYEQDKERVWQWLDHFLNEQNFLIDKFKKNDIPYVYFNLDEDKYTDLFIGYEDLIQRDCTHRKHTWKDASENEKWKYEKVEDIAKEYISVRKARPLELR
tara:strand:+ start:96 stop:1052 length:957 start_codon:yes stop_codon:yes gene_type:complete